MRQLAAEAEALQGRAAVALRLARLRMQGGEGGGRDGGGEGGATDAGGTGAGTAPMPGLTGHLTAAGTAREAPQVCRALLPHQQPQEPRLGELAPVQQEAQPEQRPQQLATAYGQPEGPEPEDWGQPQAQAQPFQQEQKRGEMHGKAPRGGQGPATAGAPVAGSAAAATTAAGDVCTHASAPTGAQPASALPYSVHVVLQLVVLAAAVLEAVLLWAARVGERASGGVLRVPRPLVQAPPAALRGGAMLAAVLLELLACLLIVLRGRLPA